MSKNSMNRKMQKNSINAGKSQKIPKMQKNSMNSEKSNKFKKNSSSASFHHDIS
jgi:hypothetical protein